MDDEIAVWKSAWAVVIKYKRSENINMYIIVLEIGESKYTFIRKDIFLICQQQRLLWGFSVGKEKDFSLFSAFFQKDSNPAS